MKLAKDFKFTVIIEGYNIKQNKDTKDSKTFNPISKDELEEKIFSFRNKVVHKRTNCGNRTIVPSWEFTNYYIKHSTGVYPTLSMIPPSVLKDSYFEFKPGEQYIAKVKGNIGSKIIQKDTYRVKVISPNGKLSFEFYKPKGRTVIEVLPITEVMLVKKIKNRKNGTILISNYIGKL